MSSVAGGQYTVSHDLNRIINGMMLERAIRPQHHLGNRVQIRNFPFSKTFFPST